MKIGIPREIKDKEHRVACTPGGVRMLTQEGHEVLVETLAGEGSGFSEVAYAAAGAGIVPKAWDVFTQAQYPISRDSRLFLDTQSRL